jgi:hypothetical protein
MLPPCLSSGCTVPQPGHLISCLRAALLRSSSDAVVCRSIHVLLRPHGRLRAIGSLQLSQDTLDMDFDRCLSQSKLSRNVLV